MEILKRNFIAMTLVVMALQLVLSNVSLAVSPSVTINEVSWAGSEDGSNDEWIELYNPGSQSVDLAGWYIEDDGSPVYAIGEGVIEAHGYFLIEDSELATDVTADAVIPLSLANSGDSLVLRDAGDSEVDSVNTGGTAWFAGNSVSKATMERIDPELGGDLAGNWASATSGNGAAGRAGAAILGSPGSINSVYEGSGPRVMIDGPVDVYNAEVVNFSVGVTDAEDLFSYGFEIDYDPNVLSFQSAVEGAFLANDGEATAFNTALENGQEGTLIVAASRLVSGGVTGGGELFSLEFLVTGNQGESSAINFAAASFLSDSIGDVTASLMSTTVNVGDDSINPISGLEVDLGVEGYSLELTWAAPVSGADSYVVQRKAPDGSFVTLAEVSENSYVDDGDLIPQLVYEYQVITVKIGVWSDPVAADGIETRGLRGDNDRSGRVDGRDLDRLARSYGAAIGDGGYDPLKDSNYDGQINGSDLIDIGANFGLAI